MICGYEDENGEWWLTDEDPCARCRSTWHVRYSPDYGRPLCEACLPDAPTN